MSFNISYIFDLQDKMSKKLGNISRNMQETSRSIQKSGNNIRQTFKDIPIWTSLYLEKAGNDLRKFNNKMQNFSQKMFAFRNQALFVSAPIGLFANSTHQEFAKLEQMQIQMGVAFGDTSKMMIENADAVAKATALSKAGVYGLYSDLRNQVNLADKDILSFSNNLINTIYGLGAGGNFDNIVTQLIQGLGKGELELQDIKSLQASKIPIIKMVAEAMGKTNAQIYELVSEKGGAGITRKMLFKAFALYGEKYKNAQEVFAKSAEGVRSKLGETIDEFKSTLGEALHTGGLSDILTLVTNGFEKLTKYIENLSPLSKKFLTYFTLLAVTLPPILLMIGLIASTIGFIGIGLGILLSPISLIVIGITAIVALIVIFRKEILNAIKATWQFLDKWTTIGSIIRGISAIFNWIGKQIDNLINTVSRFLAKFDILKTFGDFLAGGTGAYTVNQPNIQSNTKSPVDQLTTSNSKQSSTADINVNFGNMPKNTTVETKQSKGSWLNLGMNTMSFGI